MTFNTRTTHTPKRVHCGPMVVVVSLHITVPHYHHYAGVSDSIGLLKCLPGTVCSMCV